MFEVSSVVSGRPAIITIIMIIIIITMMIISIIIMIIIRGENLHLKIFPPKDFSVFSSARVRGRST